MKRTSPFKMHPFDLIHELNELTQLLNEKRIYEHRQIKVLGFKYDVLGFAWHDSMPFVILDMPHIKSQGVALPISRSECISELVMLRSIMHDNALHHLYECKCPEVEEYDE